MGSVTGWSIWIGPHLLYKDLFDRTHNSITFDIVSRCYEKIKAIIVVKQKFAKICKNSICLLNFKFTNPFLATLRLGRTDSRVASARLWICKFVDNKQMAFLQIFVSQQFFYFIFKTSGYNVECDGWWVWSNRSLLLWFHFWWCPPIIFPP